ncbi:PREDICTED: uncharacterized protein LOC107357656 [Paramuricea clavata]|uniref:PREDICTED: uncharacterized protein LOC107357656 n=1 Tax=Paramuricea clavata TaxID=317549 RepID=A0A6S7IX54_PARCT|nr:PREDICTED: uncharacterized protein LOC107357656 [Paramuricea clavata]
MTVHMFGNTCSPAVANFCLRRTTEDGEEIFGSAAKEFVNNNFYIDDGLTSTPLDTDAIPLVKNTQALLATANIRLHKVVSNSIVVMESFPAEDRIDNLKDLDLKVDPIPVQRSLGMHWDVEKDAFTFRISLPEKPYTRRGVLAIVNSTYDPLGLITPITLGGRLLLRKLTDMRNKRSGNNQLLGWDEVLPSSLLNEWLRWRDALYELQDVLIPRCYHPNNFGQITRVELHAFSDASEDAIGATVYLKLVDNKERVSVSLIFAQTKLAPRRLTTIPRLELYAAVLTTQATRRVLKELTIEVNEVVFYSDPKVVLGYIQNEKRRFYSYVANRVQIIRQISSPTQWRYVGTSINPADLATRSISPKQLLNTQWFQGPEFLRNPHQLSPSSHVEMPLNEEDPEIRPLLALKLNAQQHVKGFGSRRFERFSRWSTLRRAVARLILKIRTFKLRRDLDGEKSSMRPAHPNSENIQRRISSDLLKSAEEVLTKTVQGESFAPEIDALTSSRVHSNRTLTHKEHNHKTSHLYRLDPFLDEYGILHVGGRTRCSHQTYHEKHPAFLPKDHCLSYLVINHYHEKTHHQGQLISQGAVLQGGFWIISCRRMVSKLINRCVTCKRLRGKVQEQHMSDLPFDHLETPPPFTNVGFDVFGPWVIHMRKLRGGTSNSKRWGLIFTCLNSRAVHIEVLDSMDSSSFICGLRRFFAIRGPAAVLRCDRGTNFLGGKTELENALNEMDQDSIQHYLSEEGCQWLFNPPHASHFGGTWERQIGTIRRVLDVMLSKLGPRQLTHDLLVTLMAEVSAIVNAHPIGVLPTDPDHPQPLSPALLLTMKT